MHFFDERLATAWINEESKFDSPYGQEFSLLNIADTVSVVHPSSCLMGTRGSFSGGKAAEV
jgi:hypothetical protein